MNCLVTYPYRFLMKYNETWRILHECSNFCLIQWQTTHMRVYQIEIQTFTENSSYFVIFHHGKSPWVLCRFIGHRHGHLSSNSYYLWMTFRICQLSPKGACNLLCINWNLSHYWPIITITVYHHISITFNHEVCIILFVFGCFDELLIWFLSRFCHLNSKNALRFLHQWLKLRFGFYLYFYSEKYLYFTIQKES